jgi:hypothetical protein
MDLKAQDESYYQELRDIELTLEFSKVKTI